MKALPKLHRPLFLIGTVILFSALAWWALVFSVVLRAQLLSETEAVKCIGVSTGLCSLASALCGGAHLFDIRWYSPGLFWLGVAFLASALWSWSAKSIG